MAQGPAPPPPEPPPAVPVVVAPPPMPAVSPLSEQPATRPKPTAVIASAAFERREIFMASFRDVGHADPVFAELPAFALAVVEARLALDRRHPLSDVVAARDVL